MGLPYSLEEPPPRVQWGSPVSQRKVTAGMASSLDLAAGLLQTDGTPLPRLTPGAQCEACGGASHPPARLRDRHQGPVSVLPCPHPCLPHLAPPPVIRAKRSPSPGRGQQPFPASLLGFFITYKTFWTGEPWTRRSRQEGQEPACQVPQASPRQCHVLSPSDVSASCRPSRSDAGLSPLCPETPHACWPHTSGTGQQGLAAGPAKAWGGV